MCLYLRDKVAHRATSNIYVWKALIEGMNGYCSPIRYYNYTLGKTYKSELIREVNAISKGLHSIGYNIDISHSCNDIYECNGDSGNYFVIRGSIHIIGLCVIPEGSCYYTDGYFYASDTLKFLRTLTVDEFFNYMMNR